MSSAFSKTNDIERCIAEILEYENTIDAIYRETEIISESVKTASKALSEISGFIIRDSIRSNGIIPLSPIDGLVLGIGGKALSSAMNYLGEAYTTVASAFNDLKLQPKRIELAKKKIPQLKAIIPRIGTLEEQVRKHVSSDAKVSIYELSGYKYAHIYNNLANQFEMLCRLRRINVIGNILLSEYLIWTKGNGRQSKLMLPDAQQILDEEILGSSESCVLFTTT